MPSINEWREIRRRTQTAHPGKFQIVTEHWGEYGLNTDDLYERARHNCDTLEEAREKAGTEWDYWKKRNPREYLIVEVYNDQAQELYCLDDQKRERKLSEQTYNTYAAP